MSTYGKLLLRLAVLSLLATAVTLLAQPAKAFDCRSDCLFERTQCSQICANCSSDPQWPCGADEGCFEVCTEDYLACLSNC
jgi:hypothetical protein